VAPAVAGLGALATLRLDVAVAAGGAAVVGRRGRVLHDLLAVDADGLGHRLVALLELLGNARRQQLHEAVGLLGLRDLEVLLLRARRGRRHLLVVVVLHLGLAPGGRRLFWQGRHSFPVVVAVAVLIGAAAAAAAGGCSLDLQTVMHVCRALRYVALRFEMCVCKFKCRCTRGDKQALCCAVMWRAECQVFAALPWILVSLASLLSLLSTFEAY